MQANIYSLPFATPPDIETSAKTSTGLPALSSSLITPYFNPSCHPIKTYVNNIAVAVPHPAVVDVDLQVATVPPIEHKPAAVAIHAIDVVVYLNTVTDVEVDKDVHLDLATAEASIPIDVVIYASVPRPSITESIMSLSTVTETVPHLTSLL